MSAAAEQTEPAPGHSMVTGVLARNPVPEAVTSVATVPWEGLSENEGVTVNEATADFAGFALSVTEIWYTPPADAGTTAEQAKTPAAEVVGGAPRQASGA